MSGNELTNETMEGVTVDFSEMPKSTNVLTKVAVVGLIAAGLEHVTDVKAPKEELLKLVKQK